MEGAEEGELVAAAGYVAIGLGPLPNDLGPTVARSGRGIAARPVGRAHGREMVPMTVAMPIEMQAWVAAWGAVARYGDIGDYVRDVIRQDQEGRAYLVEIDAALHPSAMLTRNGSPDIAKFIRLHRNRG